MEIVVKRIALKEYTIGHLYINGQYFCDTLEPKVRDFNKNGYFDNGEVKIPNKTAVPYGKYFVTLKVVSPKFGKKAFYKKVCNGKLPRLLNVSSFEGVLIHCGNSVRDTQGCVCVGENKVVGGLINSQKTFEKLYPILEKADQRGEDITITFR